MAVAVSKEGWLIKLSGFVFRTWEQRWFQISGSSLLYFRLRTDTEPRQTFDLKGAHVARAAEGKIGAPTAFCMELTLPGDQPKSYFMCTETEDELLSWIDALSLRDTPSISESPVSDTLAYGSPMRSNSASSVYASPSRIDSKYRCVNALAANETFDSAIYAPPESMDENARIVLSRVWPLPSDLLSTPHTLVKTGELQEFYPNKGKRKARQLLLLNDVLLLTERDSDGFYNLKVHMSLSGNPQILVSDDSPLELQIRVHTGRVFILYAKKQEERDAWLRAIRYSVAASSSSSSSSSSTDVSSNNTMQESSTTSSAVTSSGSSAGPAWGLSDNDL